LRAGRIPQALAGHSPSSAMTCRGLKVGPAHPRAGAAARLSLQPAMPSLRELGVGPRAVSHRGSGTSAPSPEGRRELPGGCSWPSQSLSYSNGDGEQTSEM